MDEDAKAWIRDYAQEMGVASPSDDEIERLLRLAAAAAHAAHRSVAPVTTWLAGRAGLDLDAALRLAEELAARRGEPGNADQH